MQKEIQKAKAELAALNPGLEAREGKNRPVGLLNKVLVANRGEIAKRFFMAFREEGIPSVAVICEPDRDQSWSEFADEVIYIGKAMNYTNIPVLLAAVEMSGADAVYPGYGFLSENYRFVDALSYLANELDRTITFMGPSAEIMRGVGNKLDARAMARNNGVVLFEGTQNITDIATARSEAERVGYPVIVKLNAGGGGKGMTPVFEPSELERAIDSSKRIGASIYQDDSYYMERFIVNPVHIEVQIFNGIAVGIRKCAVQRRNQKVIEESGESFLDAHMELRILSAAETMAAISGYKDGGGAGTVEFLYDADKKEFGFLEINTRLQVEYPVTDLSLGIDLVKWQILHFDGRGDSIPYEHVLKQRFVDKEHAIQCRIYAEDPENDYAPSPGKILEMDLPTFNGIRCDFGFKKGDEILPDYDPMMGKLIAYGKNRKEAMMRIERALSELYVKGITTNIDQLLRIVRHEKFRKGDYTNRLLDDTSELVCAAGNPMNRERASVFGALAEYVFLVMKAEAECFLSDDLESLLLSERLNQIPTGFIMNVYGESFRVDLLQTGLYTFYAYVNGKSAGSYEIVSRLNGSDDFHVRTDGVSYPIRTDRRTALTTLRTLDDRDRIIYYRMKIKHLGSGERSDPAGMLRAPFQGSFVKFAERADDLEATVAIGSSVKKGDPIIIISAMKMETTLRAPVDGVIDYLSEDGDMSRLVRGHTSDGLVQGKAISEGEPLAIILPEGEEKREEGEEFASLPPILDSNNLLDRLNDPELPAFINAKPEIHVPILLQLIRATYLGYVLKEDFLDTLEKAIAAVDVSYWSDGQGNKQEKEIEGIIEDFISLKRIFSPALISNLSFFGELNQLIKNWDDENYRPLTFFRNTLNEILPQYGLSRWSGGSRNNPDLRLAFLFMLRGYHAAQNHSGLVQTLVRAIDAMPTPSISLLSTLNRLMVQEQAERDDSLSRYTRRVLIRKNPPGKRNREQMQVVGLLRRYNQDYKKFVLDPFLAFPGENGQDLKQKMERSLETLESGLFPDATPGWACEEIEARVKSYDSDLSWERLYSPEDHTLMYRLRNKETKEAVGYVCLTLLPDGYLKTDLDENGIICGSEEFETLAIAAVRIVAAYESLERLERNRIEILGLGKSTEMDLTCSPGHILNYRAIHRISHNVLRFFSHVRIECLLLELNAIRPGYDKVERKSLSATFRNGRLHYELLQPDDEKNPYFSGVSNARNQRIYDRDKWPVECWRDECFDPGSYSETMIHSVDASTDENGSPRPVGARIYEGKIDGRAAVFFMKDSRIAGGATGDLEGRKFVAAAYIAYRRNVPLYVWNDGAGANIKQGMVSLNRASEGFMMNALLAHRVSPDEFLRYCHNCEDPVLIDLFKELDDSLKFDEIRSPHGLFLAAIGVGSSTGLDVYGSSQAALQLMLDTEESYRVLTGSAVIKAVTGEELSNYEIGGARVMGNWTGTVDLVADGKIELVASIRRIQALFAFEEPLSSIARSSIAAVREKEEGNQKLNVLTESILRTNVDRAEILPIKDKYYGSRSLLAAFAKLGGRRVLIMGPRTHLGIRSLASVIKAKELLSMAGKTGSAQIFVIGERWYQSLEVEDHLAIRARMDWIQSLYRLKGPRIHIVTHTSGLRKVTLNGAADAVIFVTPEELNAEDRRFAAKTAGFIVADIAAAFDLAQRLINLIDPLAGSREMQNEKFPPTVPSIPDDHSQPFDMIGDVIHPLFDGDSFLEFFTEMNDPAGGPTLITGLARLEGRTVGIIADQPLEGGAPDAPGTEKFRYFMEFLAKHEIPVMMLSNAPGFVPGTKQERLRIQQIGGESLDVNVLTKMPVVSVVLNQNYGGRQIHAFSKFLRPGIAYIALAHAQIGVMGAQAAFDLFMGAKVRELNAEGKAKEAENMRDEYLKNYRDRARADNDALSTGVVDWTVDAAENLRENVIRAMAVATERAEKAFGTVE